MELNFAPDARLLRALRKTKKAAGGKLAASIATIYGLLG
jgi:hypothetical protein